VCRYAAELDARVQSLEEEVRALRAENKALGAVSVR
jgi:outer membrane murein-binding lipoprotein Lpp